jgi:uncharacterized protein (DUF3084 family)
LLLLLPPPLGQQRKLESSLGETQRAAAKYKERVAQLSTKGPAFNEQVATLQAEVKQLKASAAQLVEDNKVSTCHEPPCCCCMPLSAH